MLVSCASAPICHIFQVCFHPGHSQTADKEKKGEKSKILQSLQVDRFMFVTSRAQYGHLIDIGNGQQWLLFIRKEGTAQVI